MLRKYSVILTFSRWKHGKTSSSCSQLFAGETIWRFYLNIINVYNTFIVPSDKASIASKSQTLSFDRKHRTGLFYALYCFIF
jgi:hypothetical protein